MADSADLQETYINYVAPQAEQASGQEKVNKKALKEAQDLDRKHAAGNPVAARAAGQGRSSKAIKTGQEPAPDQAGAGDPGGAAADDPRRVRPEQDLRLVRRDGPEDRLRRPHLRPGRNVPSGPLHNNIPNPANFATTPGSAPDNNSFWVDDFSPEHFDKMLYTERASPSGSART